MRRSQKANTHACSRKATYVQDVQERTAELGLHSTRHVCAVWRPKETHTCSCRCVWDTGGVKHWGTRGPACMSTETCLWLSHTHTHWKQHFPPSATPILLSHLVIHLSLFPFSHLYPIKHIHTCSFKHTPPPPTSTSFPLCGSLQHELAEMYSRRQAACAEQQPNIIISGWSKSEKDMFKDTRQRRLMISDAGQITKGLQEGVWRACCHRVGVSHTSPEGKKFYCRAFRGWGRRRALYLLIYLFNFMMITFLAVYLGGDF